MGHRACDENPGARTCSAYLLDIVNLSFIDKLLAPLKAAPLVSPAKSSKPLSMYTCSWWRQADDAHRLGMVQRIRHFATMPVSGSTPYGYGAGLSDDRATKLFNSRCSTFGAGPFALYKLYGAAAPFSALAQGE